MQKHQQVKIAYSLVHKGKTFKTTTLYAKFFYGLRQ